ncbi:MAG: MarR family winged helix-turn-helix transcriptional regulator [Myxococcota bacterium]
MAARRRVDLLERIGNLIRAEDRETAHAAGLQPVQLDVLAYLDRCNRYSDTPAAVAEYLALTRGTVSQSIQRLEEKGLVRRRADESDRRVSHLEPTPAGRKVLRSRSRNAIERATAQAAGGQSIDRALEQWLRTLQRANGRRSFGVCASCRFFERLGRSRYRCGLTQEPLSARDSERICREHEHPRDAR